MLTYVHINTDRPRETIIVEKLYSLSFFEFFPGENKIIGILKGFSNTTKIVRLLLIYDGHMTTIFSYILTFSLLLFGTLNNNPVDDKIRKKNTLSPHFTVNY